MSKLVQQALKVWIENMVHKKIINLNSTNPDATPPST